MFYLAIESATKMCSVALFENDQLIDFIEEGGAYSHAEKLAPFVDQLLKQNNLKAKQLAAIAISAGPGSYTGLRIGLSLAKGLCFATDIPLIAISTHLGMAAGARDDIQDKVGLYCAMIDARRMEVYHVIFDSDLQIKHALEAKIIDQNSFDDLLKDHTIYFLGDGAAKCEEVISHPNAKFPSKQYISARYWGKVIHEKFNKEEFEDLAYFEPNYLKSFQAGKPKPLV